MNNEDELNIAEIPFESGIIRFRYVRYLSIEKNKWIKHGLYCAYYPSGNLASEGTFKDGYEEGLWKDFHENGQLAAEGMYKQGKKIGLWRYWDSNGKLEDEENCGA